MNKPSQLLFALVFWLICVHNGQAQPADRYELNRLLLRTDALVEEFPMKAETQLRSVIEASKRAGEDSLLFEGYLRLSTVLRTRTMSDSALHYLFLATQLAQEKKQPIWHARGNLRISRIYRDLDLLDKADEFVQAAERAIAQGEFPKIKALILQAKSIIEWNRENFDLSHKLIREASAIAQQIGDTTLLISFSMDQALEHFQNEQFDAGIGIYDSLLNEKIVSTTRNTIYHNLISIYIETNELKQADIISKVFIETAMNFSDPSQIVQAKFDRILVLQAMGKADEALNIYFEMDAMEDSLYTDELSHALSDMQARFDVKRQEAELELARTELENGVLRQRLLLAGASALLVLLVSSLFIFRQRVRNKALAAAKEKQEKELFQLKNIELKSAFDQIEEKNREITDSITYAKRIQEAILPPDSLIQQRFPSSFIYYKPKDIVAGDFYYLEHLDGSIILAAADCTGHGVPGALVSVVCHNALNRAIREFKCTMPGDILEKTSDLITEAFAMSSEEIKDGMDISIVTVTASGEIYWAGAYNPLYSIYKSENEFNLLEIIPTKRPVGKSDAKSPFITHTLDKKNLFSIYLFTDGYADQFGGPKGKKLKQSGFKDLLLSVQDKSIADQRDILSKRFEGWRGELEQVDDVCVIGLKIA